MRRKSMISPSGLWSFSALTPRRIAAMRIPVSREPGAARDVSPLELFFDLVYVFAIGQLSHHLVVAPRRSR